MKYFYLKKNNSYFTKDNISNYLTKLKKIKNNKNKFIDKKYIDKHIRKGEIINIQFLISTNEINKFTLNGLIFKKSKPNSINSTVSIKSLISGVKVKFNVHLYSDGIRLM